MDELIYSQRQQDLKKKIFRMAEKASFIKS